MENKENKIVKNNSKGYGYNYASLSDIAGQGYTIPKMKTGTDELTLKEYIFYYDTELKDWVRGAQVVIPENIISKDGKNKMNSAQLYGSAETYARRYTVLLALGLACDDDSKIENGEELVKASVKQIETMRKLYSEEDVAKIVEYYQLDTLEDLSKELATKYISQKLEKKNGQK